MLQTLRIVFEGTLERIRSHVMIIAPSLLAALTFIIVAYITAWLARWILYKVFKGQTIDKFLRQSGLAFLIDSSGRLRATRMVAEAVYWVILLSGALLGLSVFNTELTTRMIQELVFLLPSLLVAVLIIIAGAWLSQYLGRSLLVWAVNENLPAPRRLASLLRIVIMFVAIVVAADHLNFARYVFLASFIILVGGAVLAASLAIGLGTGTGLRWFFEEKKEQEEETNERPLWKHL